MIGVDGPAGGVDRVEVAGVALGSNPRVNAIRAPVGRPCRLEVGRGAAGDPAAVLAVRGAEGPDVEAPGSSRVPRPRA